MDDIEILGCNGGGLQYRRSPAHDDEFHSLGQELGQQRLRISDGWVFHARNLLAKRASATPARSLSRSGRASAS